jgi:hypothetical protein
MAMSLSWQMDGFVPAVDKYLLRLSLSLTLLTQGGIQRRASLAKGQNVLFGLKSPTAAGALRNLGIADKELVTFGQCLSTTEMHLAHAEIAFR